MQRDDAERLVGHDAGRGASSSSTSARLSRIVFEPVSTTSAERRFDGRPGTRRVVDRARAATRRGGSAPPGTGAAGRSSAARLSMCATGTRSARPMEAPSTVVIVSPWTRTSGFPGPDRSARRSRPRDRANDRRTRREPARDVAIRPEVAPAGAAAEPEVGLPQPELLEESQGSAGPAGRSSRAGSGVRASSSRRSTGASLISSPVVPKTTRITERRSRGDAARARAQRPATSPRRARRRRRARAPRTTRSRTATCPRRPPRRPRPPTSSRRARARAQGRRSAASRERGADREERGHDREEPRLRPSVAVEEDVAAVHASAGRTSRASREACSRRRTTGERWIRSRAASQRITGVSSFACRRSA